jgi:hypothetical protein
MQSAATIQDIQERLRELSPEQLSSVFDFVSYLAERPVSGDTLQTLVASERVLATDWVRSEEEAAWADL